MVADINVGLTFPEILFSVEAIPDEGELAEDPTPQPEEAVSDAAKPLTEQKRKYNARQEDDHEDCEDETHPYLVQKTQERLC